MIDATLFQTNFHTQPLEVMGAGLHRFDVYVQTGSALAKYIVYGEDYNEAIRTFCFRFQLKYSGKKKFTNRGVQAYRVSVRGLNRLKICDDCVIKMVI